MRELYLGDNYMMTLEEMSSMGEERKYDLFICASSLCSSNDSKLVESSKLSFDAFTQCKMDIADNDFYWQVCWNCLRCK